MRSLIVEIANREGIRIQRAVLDDSGLSIGRAWNSDVIVQDRFVDADHLGLSLNEEQQILVTDFSTTNGSRLAGKHLNGTANAYRLGDVLTIGDTRLKIFDAHETVAPTALRSKWFLLAERFGTFKALLTLTVLALLAQVAQSYSRSTAPLKAEDIIFSGFGVLILVLVWSLLLGFVAKLFRGESNIKPLWVLACLGIVVANIIAFAVLITKFNMQDASLGSALSAAAFCAFSIWLLVGVFSYTTHFQSRSKWACSFFVVLGLYAISQSEEYLREPHQAWRASTETERATLPPAFLLRKGVSIDEYLLQTESLYDDQ